jgi:hypothetical protein
MQEFLEKSGTMWRILLSPEKYLFHPVKMGELVPMMKMDFVKERNCKIGSSENQ